MKNNSLYLPGFHLSTLRRKPRSAAHKLADSLAHIRRQSISSLGECFGQFIPSKVLENGEAGSFSRRRVFSKTNTFWAFFSQVLDADGGCQEVVRKMQALAASRSLPPPSASTSAYCQARAKLEISELETILSQTARTLHDRGRAERWKDRRVVVVDGTGLSKEDWQALPEKLTLRQIKVVVDNPGFRVQSFYIVTTLTDAQTYSATDIADPYYQRWDVELFFRDIKTTMGMDILRCRTPAMVRKEIMRVIPHRDRYRAKRA